MRRRGLLTALLMTPSLARAETPPLRFIPNANLTSLGLAFHDGLYGLGARSCFMMPERMAKTPASEQVKETIGSGPFRFLPGEWASGTHAGYARFDGYVARQEPPSFYAGGKVALSERAEWSA